MTSRNQIAEIFLDLKALEINRAFDYKIPDGLIGNICIGIMVVVPFGSRKEIGYVARIKEKSNLPDKNLKEIDRIIGNITLFDIKKLSLIYWMSFYYIAAIGKIIELFLPPVAKSKLERFCKPKIKPTIDEGKVTCGKQHNLNKECEKVSSAIVSLKKLNHRPFFSDIYTKEINNSIIEKMHRSFLLEGFMGSYYKTLLYLNLCSLTLEKKRKVLILVPEIISAEKLYTSLKVDFGQKVCIYHSEMSEKKRFEAWYGIWTDSFEVIIGTRSALFAPIKDLGLVIIDDEHDLSYKDSSMVRYNAQDIALRLGKILKIPVVFTSPTPSISIRFKAENENNFKIIEVSDGSGSDGSGNGTTLEKVVVDLKTIDRYKDDIIITNTLHKAISAEISSGNKVIVFMNKLGFSNFLVCTKCGAIPKCPVCNLSYRYHKTGKKLVCYHCGKEIYYEGTCTACGSDSISFSGSGIEKVEASLNLRFKDVPVFRIDSESVGKKSSEVSLLKEINSCGPAIIIGTQMIMKDYGIENVTLAAIISCDNMLELPDYHSYERVFQVVNQISLKVNGYDKRGKIIIQTFNPENIAIRNFVSGSYKDFYLEELVNRKELGYPPYSSLVNIIISGSSENEVKSEITKLTENIYEKISNIDFVLLGPVPSPFLKLNIYYRWHIIIKTKEFYKFAVKFGKVLRNFKKTESNKIIIDVDPIWIL